MAETLEDFVNRIFMETEIHERIKTDKGLNRKGIEREKWHDGANAVYTEDDLEYFTVPHGGDILMNAHVPIFDSGYFPKAHSHTWYELTYVHSGSFQMGFSSERLILNSGDFILTNVGVTHTVNLIDRNSRVINFLIMPKLLNNLFVYMILDNSRLKDFLLTRSGAGTKSEPYLYWKNKGGEASVPPP